MCCSLPPWLRASTAALPSPEVLPADALSPPPPPPPPQACCAAFDRDDEFFATVGVSRRVKIFDFAACLEGGDAVMHYPALQITTRSKLSSVAWSAYVKSQLISSDYGGLIQLWDASTAGEAAQYDEHARRVWSVDFSHTDPMRFLRWAPGWRERWREGRQGMPSGQGEHTGAWLVLALAQPHATPAPKPSA